MTQATWVSVDVPKKYALWFEQHRAYPVQVQLTTRNATVIKGPTYQIHAVNSERIAAYKPLNSGMLCVGEVTKFGVIRPLSDAARHDLGIIRSVAFKTSYPAPLAYEMVNKDFVHPGDCFNKHRSVLIRRTHFSMRNDEARCAICKEAFE